MQEYKLTPEQLVKQHNNRIYGFNAKYDSRPLNMVTYLEYEQELKKLLCEGINLVDELNEHGHNIKYKMDFITGVVECL